MQLAPRENMGHQFEDAQVGRPSPVFHASAPEDFAVNDADSLVSHLTALATEFMAEVVITHKDEYNLSYWIRPTHDLVLSGRGN